MQLGDRRKSNGDDWQLLLPSAVHTAAPQGRPLNTNTCKLDAVDVSASEVKHIAQLASAQARVVAVI